MSHNSKSERNYRANGMFGANTLYKPTQWNPRLRRAHYFTLMYDCRIASHFKLGCLPPNSVLVEALLRVELLSNLSYRMSEVSFKCSVLYKYKHNININSGKACSLATCCQGPLFFVLSVPKRDRNSGRYKMAMNLHVLYKAGNFFIS